MSSLAGVVSCTPPATFLSASGTTRWLMSLACVVAPGATSAARAMLAFGVATVNLVFHGAHDRALEIDGRGPLKRYGGE